jgi:energy-coupling factor transporter ATP-binding protein EcfA2
MLVDEVLAVGDSRFWQKSISKMRDLNAAGMTILLVTHDLWLVQTISSRAICLEKGRIVIDGTPLQAIGQYKNLNRSAPAVIPGAAGQGQMPAAESFWISMLMVTRNGAARTGLFLIRA